MHIRPWFLASLLTCAAVGQVQLRLIDLPGDLELPLPAGRTVLLTVHANGGDVAAIWFGNPQDPARRVPLESIGEGEHQVDLGAPRVTALLRDASPAEAMAVFATARAGHVIASVPVQYVPRSPAPRPSVVLHEQHPVQRLAWAAPGRSAPTASGERRIEWAEPGWATPREVRRIEIELGASYRGQDAIARVGVRDLPLPLSEGRAVLDVTAEVADAWLRHGELTLAVRSTPERVIFRLRARPLRLRPELVPEGPIAVRVGENVPGSADYLRVVRGPAGRPLVRTADGAPLVGGQWSPSDGELRIEYAGRRYALDVGGTAPPWQAAPSLVRHPAPDPSPPEHTARGPLRVAVTGVPDDLVLPVPAGRTVALRASVTGEPTAVWLAQSPDADARVPMLPVGGGEFRMDLGNPMVAALLSAQGGFRTGLAVFALAGDGAVSQSNGIRYTPQTDAARPRLVVHERRRTRVVEWAAPGYAAPGEVTSIEVVHRESDSNGVAVGEPFARLGGQDLPLAVGDATTRRLVITSEVEAAWIARGELSIGWSGDPEGPRFRLRVFPVGSRDRDGAGESFTVLEGETAAVPGTGESVHVSVDEVTGAEAMVRLVTVDGVTLARGFVSAFSFPREGSCLPFESPAGQAVLIVDRVVNSLFGRDSVTFHVDTGTQVERDLIEETLRMVAASPLRFWRQPRLALFEDETGKLVLYDPRTSIDGAAFTELMRAGLRTWGRPVASVEDFLDATVHHRWSDPTVMKKGRDYVRKADGTEIPLADWLREQIATLRTGARAGRK